MDGHVKQHATQTNSWLTILIRCPNNQSNTMLEQLAHNNMLLLNQLGILTMKNLLQPNCIDMVSGSQFNLGEENQ